MNRRSALLTLLTCGLFMDSKPAAADGSGGDLASYYDRNLALIDGVVYDWSGNSEPRRVRGGVVQVGVGRDACALLGDGDLVSWSDAPARAVLLRQDVANFAVGRSGWFAIDRERTLWYGTARTEPRRVAGDVAAACIGDGADYYVTREGSLSSRGWPIAASTVMAGCTRPGLRRDGARRRRGASPHRPCALLQSNRRRLRHRRQSLRPAVLPRLGDKADRWGRIFEGAVAIATGASHSLAIRADRTLWVWGRGFSVEPRKLFDGVAVTAAGDTVTLARTLDGALWQWDRADRPRKLVLR